MKEDKTFRSKYRYNRTMVIWQIACLASDIILYAGSEYFKLKVTGTVFFWIQLAVAVFCVYNIITGFFTMRRAKRYIVFDFFLNDIKQMQK